MRAWLRQTVINAPNATTRNQLYDGVDLVADYDSADVLMRRYVHGPGVDEPLVIYEGAGTGTKNCQYADHLGSIVGTADGTSTSTAIFTYGPFGESSLTTGQRYGYTGQRSMAALGLLYYKARFYSPSLGRFLQPDPIGYADDLNLYAYVGNNPVNFTDPSGLVANWAKGAVLAGTDAAGKFLEKTSTYMQSDGFLSDLERNLQALPVAGFGFATIGKVGGVMRGVESGARELAKAEVFAARTAPELKQIYGWGNGAPGVEKAMQSLDASAMARIQGGVSRAEVEATRSLYQEAAAAGRGGAVAPQRVEYMNQILKLWKN